MSEDSSARIGRFAPSPTGPLHMGSLFAAVAGWLDARAMGARWLVRMEDLDPPREVPGAADAILQSLDRHGLHWDGPVVYQSDRAEAYEAATHQLLDAALAYACECTRRHLRELPNGVYPGTCVDRALSVQPGVRSLRVRTTNTPIAFTDRLQGNIEQRVRDEVGDFIIRRRDGLWAYQLAVVVDDAWQGVTDVVRGIDLLDSTPRQIQLQQHLGVPTPTYLHLPVLRHDDGAKLSKQTGARGIDDADASANVAAVLALLGLPANPKVPAHEQLAVAMGEWHTERLPKLDFTVGGALGVAVSRTTSGTTIGTTDHTTEETTAVSFPRAPADASIVDGKPPTAANEDDSAR